MKQNDWLILAGVLLLLWWLSQRSETVTTNISFPNQQRNPDGSYAGDTTRTSGGDLLERIINQQSDQIQYF